MTSDRQIRTKCRWLTVRYNLVEQYLLLAVIDYLYQLGKSDFKKIVPIFFLIISTQAYAIDIPSAGSILQQQRQFQTLPAVSEKDIQPSEKQIQAVKIKDSDIKITVKEFVLTGDITIFSQKQLQAVIGKFIGKSLNVDELNEALELIYDEYKKKGYLIVKVFFPKQDVTEGAITIKIIEASIDDSEEGVSIIEQELRVNKEYVLHIVKQVLKPGSIINQNDLERATLILNDMPGVNASSSLKKGSKENSTKVFFDLNEADRYKTYASTDNTGNRYTGRYMTMAGVNVNGLSGYGDQLSVNYTNSLGGGDLNLLSIGYSSSILYSGLRAGIKSDFLRYELGEELKDADIKGESNSYSLYLSYPILRKRLTNLIVQASYSATNLEDTASGITISNNKLEIFRTMLIANHSDNLLGGGYTYINITHSHGDNIIKPAVFDLADDQGPNGAQTAGNFNKVSFGVTRIQRASDKLSLVLSASGQYAYSNLNSAEKFQLGGAYGVRAYPTGEGNGDHGVKATIEGRYVLANSTPVGEVRLIGFYDYGMIHQFRDKGTIPLITPNSYSLSGVGVGVSFGKPNEFDGSINIVTKIGSNKGEDAATGYDADGRDPSSRFWFSLRRTF